MTEYQTRIIERLQANLEVSEAEVVRLRAELNLLKMGPAGSAFALEAEVERLRAEKDNYNTMYIEKFEEAKRLQTDRDLMFEKFQRVTEENERLRARVGRLTKAVTWLTGALPRDPEFDWERARSKAVLEEA